MVTGPPGGEPRLLQIIIEELPEAREHKCQYAITPRVSAGITFATVPLGTSISLESVSKRSSQRHGCKKRNKEAILKIVHHNR